jgi:hypothetical protein
MTTLMITHEIEDAARWDKAWKKGPGGRHELFAQKSMRARTFHDPKHPTLRGLVVEVPDLATLEAFLKTDEAQKAMKEDGVKPATIQLLTEFTP